MTRHEEALTEAAAPFEDDELVMMFMTCHPALPPDVRVALTLKVVGGFGVGEIARAFLMQEPAVAQRLVRAKRTLREHDLPFALPAPGEVGDRLVSVLDALYLMFNEGHAPTAGPAALEGGRGRGSDAAGDAAGAPLADRPARDPCAAGPDAAARRALPGSGRAAARCGCSSSRTAARGTAVLLAEGMRALDRAACGEIESRFHLEAAIAAAHAAAPDWASTDWPHILALYDALVARWPSPVAALNRVIALAQVLGADAALPDAERLAADPRLARYHLLPAVLADLHARRGDHDRAAALLDQALAHAMSEPERRLLEARRAATRGREPWS